MLGFMDDIGVMANAAEESGWRALCQTLRAETFNRLA